MKKLLLLFLGILLLAPGVLADQIDYDQVLWQVDPVLNPMSLSAEIYFEYVNPTSFDIKLVNTSSLSATSDFPATVMLTGIGFNLGPYNDILTGSVDTINFNDPKGVETDPVVLNDNWGYDNDPSSGYFSPGGVTTLSVDTVISTMNAAVEVPFDAGGKVQGPDYGVLSSAYSGTNSYPYFQDYVLITVELSNSFGNWDAFVNSVNENDVVVAFGSPTAPVPEPATLLLFGTGLVGLAGIGRKRFGKK